MWGLPALDRRLLKIQFSFLLVVLGGRCNQLAVAWWALQEIGSALAFANMIACSIAAEVLARPLLGWLGDKYNKILILKLASLTSVLTALLMVVLSATQLFNPWSVGALMLIGSAVAGVLDPLQSSIIPLFAGADQVSLAVRTKSMLSSIANLLGPVIASALIFGFGTLLTFTVDCFAMLGAALLGGNLWVAGTLSSIFEVPLAFFCGGVGLMLINIPTSAVRLLATPKQHRNRIFATVSFLSAAASPLGSFAVNGLIAHLGVALTITSLGAMVLGLSPLVFLIPDLRRVMRSPDTQLSDAYLDKYPDAFAR
ncbi:MULTISPECIES: MFS transporter [unclassified Pseudomonas]|uniref:MFS transporter n=1 Tax=unclassified Pseudomonas TaxID=196821 RepID=UPI0030D8923B